MAYRLTSLGGFELLLDLNDRARSGRLWQYFVKPSVHALEGVRAAAGGLISALRSSAGPSGTSGASAEATAAAPADLSPAQREILDRIGRIEWYHTIDLGSGIRTPGRFNHIPLTGDYRLPDRLDGLRALDVATMNGYWAFEMEKRGAREVVAVDVERLGDLDVPPLERRRMTPEQLGEKRGTGFYLAREILNSSVERRNLNVYDLSADAVGKFDFVFMGDLLLHLMNPIRAAANVCEVTSGVAHVVDCFNPFLPRGTMSYQGAAQGTWWGMSLGALERILWDAGFRKVELVHKFKAPTEPGGAAWMWRAVFRCSN